MVCHLSRRLLKNINFTSLCLSLSISCYVFLLSPSITGSIRLYLSVLWRRSSLVCEQLSALVVWANFWVGTVAIGCVLYSVSCVCFNRMIHLLSKTKQKPNITKPIFCPCIHGKIDFCLNKRQSLFFSYI